MSNKSLAAVVSVAFVAVVAILVPNFASTRTVATTNECINNLRQIDQAKGMGAIEKVKTTNNVPTWQDVRQYFNDDRKMLNCPRAGRMRSGALASTQRAVIQDTRYLHDSEPGHFTRRRADVAVPYWPVLARRE